MPQLDISTFLPQLFWLFISFGLLYFLLSKLCLPGLAKIFDERDAKVAENLKAAHIAKDRAVSVRKEYEKILAEASRSKREMLSSASEEITDMLELKLKEFDKELLLLVNDSEKKMKSFEKNADIDVSNIAKEVALSIISSLGAPDVDEKSFVAAFEKVKSEGLYGV